MGPGKDVQEVMLGRGDEQSAKVVAGRLAKSSEL